MSKRSRVPHKTPAAFDENEEMDTGVRATGQDGMDDTEYGDEPGYCYDSFVPNTESTPCSSCSSGSEMGWEDRDMDDVVTVEDEDDVADSGEGDEASTGNVQKDVGAACPAVPKTTMTIGGSGQTKWHQAVRSLIHNDNERREQGENPTLEALDGLLKAHAELGAGFVVLMMTDYVRQLLDIVESIKDNIPQCKELYAPNNQPRRELLSKACQVHNVVIMRFPQQVLSLQPLAKGDKILKKDKNLKTVKQTQNSSVLPSKKQRDFEAGFSKGLGESGITLEAACKFLGFKLPDPSPPSGMASRQEPVSPRGFSPLPKWPHERGTYPFGPSNKPMRDALTSVSANASRKLLGEKMVDSAEQDPAERKRQDDNFLRTIAQMNADAIALLDCQSGNDNPSAVPDDAPSAGAGTLAGVSASKALRTPLETLAQHVRSDAERFGVDPSKVWHNQEAQARLDHDDSLLQRNRDPVHPSSPSLSDPR